MAKTTTGKLTDLHTIVTGKLTNSSKDKAMIGKWGKNVKFVVKEKKILSLEI